MPTRPTRIARVKLARSLPRLLAIPAAAVVAGAAALAAGLLGVSGLLGLALAVAGGIMLLLGIAGALVAMSVHLDVEEAAVRVRWLGGERVYTLVPGPVTRVRLRGDEPSSLRAAPRFLPWQMGPGTLRGEEHVEVVRLAPTATAILVPTDWGRLAIAAASEETLLKALSAAAQARQRLDELEREARPELSEAPVEAAVAPEPQPEAVEVQPVEPEAPEPAPLPEPAREPEPAMPRLLTGIERAMLEQQQAEAAAWAVTSEASDATGAVEPPEAPPAEPPLAAPVVPAVPAVPREAIEPTPALEAQPAEAEEPEPAPRARRIPVSRPRPSALLVLLPLVGAAVALGVGLYLDRVPSVGSDLGRLTALALVLAGPAATIGAIMARAWWPRLVGVVVAGGLAAAVFVGRALIGG
jgi:hypothetical protein